MLKNLSLFTRVVFALLMTTRLVLAQEYPILWQDHFDDDDLLALKNVGWLYDAKNIQGQITEQRNGELFVQAGKYSIFGIG
ncbi:MAG: hypothetical protein ONB05_11145, partial [candidate division KSB1 bacterium]|nr:hypothetical protein [candidate division KSB1 bacterium]